MSFSSDVKEELSRQISKSRHCQIAEIAAIISLCGRIQIKEVRRDRADEKYCENRYNLKIQTENAAVAKKYFMLIKEAFGFHPEITVRQSKHLKRTLTYSIAITKTEQARKILQAAKLLGSSGEIKENLSAVDDLIIQKSCCKRAFLRGAFLSAGSISDPGKFYHFEIACMDYEKAKQLQELIRSFEIDAKIVQRKKYYVVYVKEGAMIVDTLNVMEAYVSLMNLENIRILKDMRNSVNRKVNCETANINKTVSAAVKQVADIEYIRDHAGLSSLPSGLCEMAQIRLEYPDASLKELGMFLSPSVGKSGVNHRLRKISNIANALRENKEEQ